MWLNSFQLVRYLFLAWLCLLLTGCDLSALTSLGAQSPTTAALPLGDALPASWQAIRDVQAVNIDDDPANEYLLLFAYDTVSAAGGTLPGPIGALIYDAQVGDESESNATPADPNVGPPINAMVPYAILPSYRRGAGQGFIAAPDQRDAVTVYPLTYHAQSADGEATGEAAVTPGVDTLLFMGGTTYLTFVWWKSLQEGYGVTQLYAPGGFEASPAAPFDWSAWQNSPTPIDQIIGVHPLHDRSLLCRRFRYNLDTELLPQDPRAIYFQQSDLGLQFCYGIPEQPFYAEAVVLAYLLNGGEQLLAPALRADATGDAASRAQFDQILQRDQIERVQDLVSYATFATEGQRAPLNAPSTSEQNRAPGVNSAETLVCAEVIPIQPEGTQLLRRWLLFGLAYQSPQFKPATPDRLFIKSVKEIAAPVDGVAVKCNQVLGG